MANSTVSRSNAIMLAVLAFLAGIFVGSVLLSELAQHRAAPVAQGMPAPAGPAPAAPAAPAPSQAQQEHLTHLEAATLQNPGDPQVWIDLGNAAFDAGMAKKAIAAYKQALQLDPNNANVLTDLGVMYRRDGEPGLAIESFARAIGLQPGHKVARMNMGIVLLHDLNDPAGALKAWKALLELDPQAAMPGGQPLAQVVRQLQEQLNAQSE